MTAGIIALLDGCLGSRLSEPHFFVEVVIANLQLWFSRPKSPKGVLKTSAEQKVARSVACGLVDGGPKGRQGLLQGLLQRRLRGFPQMAFQGLV